MSLSCSASVCPSGQGILFLFRDQATVPSNVVSLSDQREVQTLTLTAGVTGAPFTLTFGGKTTAPIAKTFAPPPVYAQWNAAVPGGGAYDLAVNLSNYASYRSVAALYEVFGGDPAAFGSLLGTATINMASATGNPATFQDGSVDRSGAPINWMPLGRFNLPGTALAVRVSGPDPALKPGDPGALLYAGSLRVRAVAGGATQLIGPDEPPGSSASTAGAGYLQYTSQPYDLAGAPGRQHQVLGAGGSYKLDASAVQSALAALPNVGAGNVACSGVGTAADPLLIRYVGAFGQQALPLIASSSPDVVPGQVAAGGNWPTVSVDGGPAIKLGNPFWGTGLGDPSNPSTRTSAPYLPYVYFPFIQQAGTRREKIRTHLNVIVNGPGAGWSPTAEAGYSDQPWGSAGAGSHASWTRQGIPPATYRISATWPATSSNTTDAVYTVTNRAGATLATYHADQTLAPELAADDGVPWHLLGSLATTASVDDLIVTLTNGASGRMVADGVRFERTGADPSVRIAPGSVVTYSAGFGWATAAAGLAPSASGAAVDNRVGSTVLPPIPPGPKTMALGWNLSDAYPYSPVIQYANLAHLYNEPGEVIARDADGYPTRFNYAAPAAPVGQMSAFLVQSPVDAAGLGRGWPNVPAGDYAVLWDGASDVRLEGTEDVSRALPGTANVGRRRVFNIQPGRGSLAPVVHLLISSSSKNGDNTFNADVRNLRVYPLAWVPDPANPPKFTPGFLAKTRSARSLRFLLSLGAIEGNPTNFGDYNPPDSRLARFGAQRVANVPIARIRNAPSNAFWRADQGIVFEVTTSAPHGLPEQAFLTFNGCPATITASTGDTLPMSAIRATAHVVSPTVFTCQGWLRGTATMANDVTSGAGTFEFSSGNNMPLRDMVDACNAAGADLYLNTSVTATDDCLVAIGQYLAANLAPGLKVRVEFMNEIWNVYTPPFFVASALSYAAGKGYDWKPAYCDIAAHHWAKIGQGLGARSGDLVRVLGSLFTVPSVTDGLAAYCQANSIGFDEVAIAPYVDNNPAGGQHEPGLSDLVDLFTSEQQMDLHELFHAYSGYEQTNPAHIAAMRSHGFASTRLISYEGGPSGTAYYPHPLHMPSRVGETSHGVHRSPRYHQFLLHHMQMQQDTGMTLLQFFYLSGEGDQVQADGSFAMWSAYNGTDQPAGTGDPTLDADNVNTPDRMDLIKSEVGGAFDRWMSRVLVARPPARRRPIPGRNGMILATGERIHG